MKTSGIDAGQIQAMLAQMRKAAQGPNADQEFEISQSLQSPAAPTNTSENSAQKVDFGDVLKQSLDQVNQLQLDSKELSKEFAMGDDTVDLADVMISGQKASIGFQATVQVRNKLVQAYTEMMNMQV